MGTYEGVANANGVFLFQETNLLAEMCGFEAKNIYRGYDWEGDRDNLPDKGNENETLLTVREQSSCMERQCCGPQRSLTFHFYEGRGGGGKDQVYQDTFLSMDKSFHIQDCICCRPEFEVRTGDSSESSKGEYIGKIEDPWACCVLNQKIMNKEDQGLYTVTGGICQVGICCPCCGDVVFDIMDSSDSKVGEVRKVFGGCGELMVGLTNFGITFPDDADYDAKLLLLSVAMGIDMMYFERNKNSNGGGGA